MTRMKFRMLTGVVVAGVALIVTACATSSVKIGINHSNMYAHIVAPDGPGPYPGVVVLHTSGGLQPPDMAYAQKLSGAGYVCMVPLFMAAYNIGSATRDDTFTTYHDRIYADLVNGIGMLRQMDKVAGRKIGAVGFSNGGYWAAALAASGAVDAGVSYYGVLSGFHGAPRRHLRESVSSGTSPILILHGRDDSIQPVNGAEFLSRLLQASGAPHEIHLYAAGHDFARSYTPAAEDAWQRTLAFLKTNLQ